MKRRIATTSLLSVTALAGALAAAGTHTHAAAQEAVQEAGQATASASDEPSAPAKAPSAGHSEIVVSGERETVTAATKTNTPLIETPQPITVITDDVFLSQGALSISDTVLYASGVRSSQSVDNRRDTITIRGTAALNYRDGMREVFGFDNSITSDPYNFAQVEVVRGPAGVLFGQGSIGGLVNVVSKRPQFTFGGEVSVRYGSFNRKEVLADVTGPIGDTVAVRLVARARDADTQVNFTPDNRFFVAPSITWRPGARTSLSVLGFYQKDDRGVTLQFLPLDATLGYNEPGSSRTITANPNGRLPFDTFVGEPGYDRFNGHNAQATGIFEHGFSDAVTIRARARYIDSNVDYRTHYPDSYTNPYNPWSSASRRTIRRINSRSLSDARVFSTDNNLTWTFDTGADIEHTLLAGVDYQHYSLRLTTGSDRSTFIDLYAPQYGNLVMPRLVANRPVTQTQVGLYVQDQIRFYDRVSVVLGARRDWASDKVQGSAAAKSRATTFRAGIIGEIGAGFSPFLSYTESFLPTAGVSLTTGLPYVPQRGLQYEAGMKWQPDPTTLVTATAFSIDNTNRLIADPTNPLNQIQTGKVRSKGFELEASRIVGDDLQLIANYAYTDVTFLDNSNPLQVGLQLDGVPRHLASVWAVKTIEGPGDWSLRLGSGVRYSGSARSYTYTRTSVSPLTYAFNNIVETPGRVLVDALVGVEWRQFAFSLNATNLLNKKYYGSCLARGDCLPGSLRNVFGTLTYKY